MNELLLAASAAAGTGLIVWWLRKGPVGPWLHSVWTSRGKVPEDFDTQSRHAWNSQVDDAVLLTHEKRGEDEDNNTAADFVLWDAEVSERAGVHKYMRRMDRWSR